MGKSTVCNEICVRWAKDEFLSDKFDAVIQIPMGMARQHSLEEILIAQIGEDDYCNVKELSGACCLIILDGMMSADLQNDKDLSRLVEGSFLSNAVLLITAKPEVCKTLSPDRVIQIVGFSGYQADQYIQNLPANSQTPFRKKLRSCPLAHIPLYLVMLSSIFQCNPAVAFPSTITDLHYLFVAINLQRTDLKTNLRSLSLTTLKAELLTVFPQENLRMLLQLSKFAYDLIFNQNSITEDLEICFTHQQLCQYDIYLPKSISMKEFKLIRPTTSLHYTQGGLYCFTSNTVLLFLCSLYITTVLSKQEQRLIMQNHFDTLPTIMIMVCALTGLEETEMFGFVYDKLADITKLTAAKCLYESQRSSDRTSHLSLSFCSIPLLPYDVLSISYVAHQYPVETLILRECGIGNSDLKILADWCGKDVNHLKHLDVSVNKLDTNALEDILKIVRSKCI